MTVHVNPLRSRKVQRGELNPGTEGRTEVTVEEVDEWQSWEDAAIVSVILTVASLLTLWLTPNIKTSFSQIRSGSSESSFVSSESLFNNFRGDNWSVEVQEKR